MLNRLRRVLRANLGDVERVCVSVATSDRFLQGAVTGTMLGIITSVASGFGQETHHILYIETHLYLSSHWFNAGFQTILLCVVVWADRHQEEWRTMLEDATGEKAEGGVVDDSEGE